MGKEERKSDIKEELRRLLMEDREIRDVVCRIVPKSEGAADKQDSIRKKGEWETLIRWLSRVFSKEGKVGTPRELKEEIEAEIQRLCEESRQLSESLRQQEEEMKTAQEELLRQREAAETYRAEAEKGREETDSLRKETESLREESGQLSARLREKDEEAEKGREEINSLRSENQRLSDRLRQQEEETKTAQEELLRQREAAETYRAEAEKGREETDSLRKELSKAKALLRKHFEKGDAIFSAYRSLPVERRERLSRVIRSEDDFESFICCLTQEEAMKAFWDMAKEADACGDVALRDRLYEIFVYSLALVNRIRNRPFELLSVKKGAAFARDEMEPAAGSKAQGKVQDVRLPGFRNLYTDAVERKSVVVL